MDTDVTKSPSPQPPRIPTAPPAAPRNVNQRRKKERSGGRGWMWFSFTLLFLVGLLALNQFALLLDGAGLATASTQGAKLSDYVIEDNGAQDEIAVIPVTGMISSAPITRGSSMVSRVKEKLDLAAQEDSVKAVILKVNSPGGEVLASDEIAIAIRDFQKETGKPVVASMGNMAASGGYYVSAPCRWIVANPLTITGSIGVIMHGYNYRGLMDKVGVAPMVFKSGRFKDMLSPDKIPEEVSDEEKQMVQGMIDETYEQFKKVILEGRTEASQANGKDGKTLVSGWTDYADGRILTGTKAHELGFADELGNLETAFERAKILSQSSTANLIGYSEPFGLADLFRIAGERMDRELRLDIDLPLSKINSGLLYFLWEGPSRY